MAEDIVYADLDIPGAYSPPSSQPRNCLQTPSWADFRLCPRWHRLILKIGAAGSVVLLVVVTVLSVWESSPCTLCPRDWLPHKRKCYWVSKEAKMWNSSQADCVTKNSHLLVTQDQEEMDYIQTTITEKNPLWIGLILKSPKRTWSWVDGSPANEDLFHSTGSPGVRDCGVLKRNQIALEICGVELKWICQKDALIV